MGYGLLESYGLFLRDEHGSIGFLWGMRDYGFIELCVRAGDGGR